MSFGNYSGAKGGTAAVHGDVMTYGANARDASYEDYDNDANFDPTLNSSSAAYFENPDNSEAYGENRWKTGGGIDTGAAKGIFAGRTRDADGTIDRVKDPPKELLPVLYAVRMQASAYNISLDATFEAAGGNARGTIPATKFCSTLVVTFHRLELTEQILAALVDAYGCGERAPAGSAREIVAPYEVVAWKGACAAQLRPRLAAPTARQRARPIRQRARTNCTHRRRCAYPSARGRHAW
jgi:hypothetical protein